MKSFPIVFWLLFLGGTPLHAAMIDLQDLQSGASMNSQWETAVLPREWTINDVQGPDAPAVPWGPQPARPVNLDSRSSLWIRFSVKPHGALTPPRWIIEFPKPGLDRIEMFRFEGADLALNEVSGDDLSVAVWPVSGRAPAFEMSAMHWTPVTYYFKISHRGPISLNGFVKSVAHYLSSQRLANLFYGVFFGSLGLLVTLAAGAAITARQISYAAFSAYAAATAMTFLTGSGLLGEWWYEGDPHTLNCAPYVSAVAAAALGVLYLALALTMKELSPVRFKAAIAFAAIGLALVVALAVTDLPAAELALAYGGVALAAALALLAHASFKGDSWTPFHIYSLLPYGFALSYPLAELALQTRIPPQVFSIIGATAVLHLALSFFALNSKIKKLGETLTRLNASSTMDPLTGTANYRRLMLRVPDLMARARHYQHHGALLLVEITNLPDFRRYGGQRGQELALIHTAAIIRDCVKNIDMVSRVNDGNFAIAIEGPVTLNEVSSLAALVIAKGLRTATEPPSHTPLALRIYIQLVPKRNETLDELLAGALRHLRAVPIADRRRIFVGQVIEPGRLERPA